MNPTLADLWRAALARGVARFIAGMLVTDGDVIYRLCKADPDGRRGDGAFDAYATNGDDPGKWVMCGLTHVNDRWVPVFDDAATKGCLLELVREAYKDAPGVPYTYKLINRPDTDGGWWHCCCEHYRNAIGSGPTEADALMAALVAAPEAA